MNAKIEELAKQAGYKFIDSSGICEDYAYFSINNFAELIIDACMRAVVADIADPRDTVELQCTKKIKARFAELPKEPK